MKKLLLRSGLGALVFVLAVVGVYTLAKSLQYYEALQQQLNSIQMNNYNNIQSLRAENNSGKLTDTMWDTLVDFVANLHLVVTPVNGECGNVTQVIATTKPTTNLCKQGIVGEVTGTGPWTWKCNGLLGGTTKTCTASTTPPQCGSLNGKSAISTGGVWKFASGSILTTGTLCADGTPSSVTVAEDGVPFGYPYEWTCSKGGQEIECGAAKACLEDIHCGVSAGDVVYKCNDARYKPSVCELNYGTIEEMQESSSCQAYNWRPSNSLALDWKRILGLSVYAQKNSSGGGKQGCTAGDTSAIDVMEVFFGCQLGSTDPARCTKTNFCHMSTEIKEYGWCSVMYKHNPPPRDYEKYYLKSAFEK